MDIDINKVTNITPPPLHSKQIPILSIVLPAYNEESALPYTLEVLENKLSSLIKNNTVHKDSYLVFVNDGSVDNTKSILHNHIDAKPSIKTILITLSTNKGHQNALLAGMEYVMDKCDCMISMDCDLQDDINAVDKFIEQYKNGYEVLSGVRNNRDTDTLFKKYSALGFYKIMKLLGVNLTPNHADYRLLSNRALKAMLSFKEVNLFLRGIVSLVGYRHGIVYYECRERIAGESKYSLGKMLGFAVDGITSFSVTPLRIVSAIGIILFVVSICFGCYVLYVKLFTNMAIYGWASTIIPLSFFSGVQLLSLGIIGEYVGKIYKEVKSRPRYFIDSIYGESKHN